MGRSSYNLADVSKASTVFVVEGEKTSEALSEIGITSTTPAHGANAPTKTDWKTLAGHEIVLWPDNDKAGESFAKNVLRLLAELDDVRVRILRTPELPQKSDAYDYISSARDGGRSDKDIAEDIWGLIEGLEPVDLNNLDPEEILPTNSSQAAKLVELAQGTKFSRDSEGKTYATFRVENHHETWSTRSQRFRQWLLRSAYEAEGLVPSTSAVSDAVAAIECRSLFEDQEQIATRVAEHDGAIYIDLCDPAWRAVRVTTHGWSVIDDPPVRFVRSTAASALPEPLPGGNIADLRRFVNLPDDESWRLFQAWLVGAFQPAGPYAILAIQGEQGSAKSTLSRIARRLTDPRRPEIGSIPRNEQELLLTAKRSWVLAIDNLSGVDREKSNALCRLATGGGLVVRKLYTDEDLTIFESSRPIILNGIEDIATRSDLASRCVQLMLPQIPDQQRTSEKNLLCDFTTARPYIFGALLNAVSTALGRIDEVETGSLPRLADFAKWATAAEPALDVPSGSIIQMLSKNADQARMKSVENSSIGPAILALMEDRDVWRGTCTTLLDQLTGHAGPTVVQRREFPDGPRKLSDLLQRLGPDLRAVGIDYSPPTPTGKSRQRVLELRKVEQESSASTASSGATTLMKKGPPKLRPKG